MFLDVQNLFRNDSQLISKAKKYQPTLGNYTLVFFKVFLKTHMARAVEYSDCISVEG